MTFPKGATDSPVYSPATFGKVFTSEYGRPMYSSASSTESHGKIGGSNERIRWTPPRGGGKRGGWGGFVRRVEEFAEHFSRLEEFPRAEDWIIEMQGQPVAYVFLPDLPERCHRANPECGNFREGARAGGARVRWQPHGPGRRVYSPATGPGDGAVQVGRAAPGCTHPPHNHARTWTCCNCCEHKRSPETRHP